METIEEIVGQQRYCKGRRGRLPLGDVAKENSQLFTEVSQALNDEIDGPSLVSPYFNALDPNLQIQRETPVHRIMLSMRVNGASITEIAEQLDYSVAHVSQVLRQPWARKRMSEMQQESSVGVLTRRIEKIGAKALSVIEELLDNEETPANVKSTTAQYAVNRLLGRPTDSIILDDKRKASDLSNEELEQIVQRELSRRSSAYGDGDTSAEII